MMTTSNAQMLAAQLFNQGNAAFKHGKWAEALVVLEQALEHHAQLVPAWLLKARCLVRLGEWMPARDAFAQVLRLEPLQYSAWLEAGHLCKQMGELQQAALAYQRAIDAEPTRFEAYVSMACVLQLQGHTEQATRAYADGVQVAKAHAPDRVRDVHLLMGRYLLDQGHEQRAVESLVRALGLVNDKLTDAATVNLMAEIRIDLGQAFLRLNQREAAMAMLTKASAATDEGTLSRLSSLSFKSNLWQEAIAVSRRCLELYPHSATAHWNLAYLLSECWQMDEAELMLQQAEALGHMPSAGAMRAAIAGKLGDADRVLRLYVDLARAENADVALASSAAMASLYTDSLSAQEVADLHRSLFASQGAHARERGSFVRTPLQGRRVRLGILSADFHHQHPVNIFMQPVLRELDRSKFEVFMYFTGESHDEQTLLARSRVDHWAEVARLNNTQLAKQIDADAIDVLLDMSGHTTGNRVAMLAQRAAPVQVTYLGYPGSTGVPNVDWLLGDAVVTPVGCEPLYTEQVLRLPNTVFCYAPEADYPFPVCHDVMATRPLTFGSFNNVPKLTQRTLRLWAQVLAEVPDSRLVLKAPSFGDASAVRVFSERLGALGVDLARVDFRGPVGLADMMAEYADIDIALDPVPYNGGTTTLQAMWMGVPVVTMLGQHFVSRMGASFMTAAGLANWVATDDAHYVAIAKQMGADRQALLALKKGMRDRLLAQPAWDVVAHTRAMEDALMAVVS
jgi:predicted O-linked N-acetylglucosamine transferase (SPINDLY family)